MRIAIFTDTFLPQINGVVTSVVNLAVGLARNGHKILIFTVSVKKTISLHKNIRVVYYNGITLPTYKEFKIVIPSGIRPLLKLRKFKPDIIHVETPFGMGAEALICAKILNIPLVGTHHTFYSEYLKHVKLDNRACKNLTNKLTAHFFNRCDMVTAASKALAGALKKYGVHKPIVVVPNTIQTTNLRFKGNKKLLTKRYGLTDKTLVCMGRVSYEKSIDVLISSMEMVIKRDPTIKLLIIGDGPNRKELESLAKKLKLENNIIFTGSKTGQDLINTTALGDVFVTPSKTDNLPLSIIEAMAIGMPIIGVDALGVPELVRHNYNGLIAEPDNARQIAMHILKLFKDKKLRKKMAKNSKKFSREFSNPLVMPKWTKLYKKLLKEKKCCH